MQESFKLGQSDVPIEGNTGEVITSVLYMLSLRCLWKHLGLFEHFPNMWQRWPL